MLTKTQQALIVQRCNNELKNIPPSGMEAVGDFLLRMAILPFGHDTEFLLESLGKPAPVNQAAKIVEEVITKHA